MANDTKQLPEADVPVEVLSALLDFYADRASGFASLFVASIFGLVTLSAIIQNYSGNILYWYVVAGVPYFAFVLSGYYIWDRFRYYAGIAHNIEQYGLRNRYRSEIEKITCIEERYYEQKKRRIKKLLDLGSHSFTVLYFVLILFLTIIVYWDLLTFFL